MDKLIDLIECIAKFDSTESDEVKARYFDVIQKDAKELSKSLRIDSVMPSLFSVNLCFIKLETTGELNIGIISHVVEAENEHEAFEIVYNSDHNYKEHSLHIKTVFEIDFSPYINSNGA